MGVAPTFKPVSSPVGPRTKATASLARSLGIARARLSEAADEATRLQRADAMTALGFIRDAVAEIDQALEALT